MTIHCPAPLQPRSVEATDADEHANNLTNWEQRYDQITAGVFHGLLEELQLPQMQVFRESTNQGIHQACCVWPNAIWFGLPYSTRATRINGHLAEKNDILVRPGACEFELMTPADYTIYGVVVRQDALQDAAERGGYALDWSHLARTERVQPRPTRRSTCLQALAALLQTAEPLHEPSALQQCVFDALLPLLDTPAPDEALATSFARRQRIVAKAQDYVREHHDQALTVPELCEKLFVSRRTLQYCFEDVLGINPMQYLRIVRLNGARRQLRNAATASKTVRDVAADWGFWHFSQFSSDYKKLFGHSPSETLRQRCHSLLPRSR
jgi:AraC family transcriptional regulator, ethanolamine operon transcriptional activator